MEVVLEALNRHKYILVNSPPGCGKTYIFNQLKSDEFVKISPTNLLCQQSKSRTIYNITTSPINKLTPKNIRFDKNVAVDEVFLFSYDEFSTILACANNNKIIMFGDSFQKRQIGEKYWYECFANPIQDIHVVNLTKIYRAKDIILQNMILKFRTLHTYQCPILDFKMITLDECIRMVEYDEFTIICGTYQKQVQLQKKIDKRCMNKIDGKDGRIYRIGQTVFMTNEHGTILSKDKIVGSEDGCMCLEHGGIQHARYTDRYEYGFIRGDVVIVDLIQGQELYGVVIDCESLFQFGSFYVAMSRVQKWDNVFLLSQPRQELQCDFNNIFQQDILQ